MVKSWQVHCPETISSVYIGKTTVFMQRDEIFVCLTQWLKRQFSAFCTFLTLNFLLGRPKWRDY